MGMYKWSMGQYEEGTDLPEGEGIVAAKFYETGRKITPPNLDFEGTIYTFTEGNEYVMVIEGNGEMGQLMEISGINITAGYGWQYESALFMAGYAENCTLPYVSESIICDGVKNLGGYAFAGDTGLTKVTISKCITNIDKYSFMNCTSLKNITIPNGVKSIGANTFYECSSLTNITIPDSVTSIGSGAFEECSGLTNVIIPDGVTSIGRYAFSGCDSLTNVTIGNGVTSIGGNAFKYSESLTAVTIDSEAIASSITANDSSGNLVENATTIYINEKIEETSIGSYITTNYTKQATSDKAGYVKYTK